MPAYNSTNLYSQIVQQEASDAFQTGCLTKESYRRILESHASKLYTPNYFIRIALALVAIIAILFTAILFGLLFGTSGSSQLAILCFFLGFACYVALELIVKNKNYYNAGIDNILMTSIIIFFIVAFFAYDIKTGYLLVSGMMIVLSFYLCVRFIDAFMAIISYLSLFMFIFLLYLKLGTIAKATAPVLMMILSAFVYAIMKGIEKKGGLLIYNFCIKSVMFLTLVTFYMSSNYFVVRELSNQIFTLHLSIHDSIPLGGFFWVTTFIIPVAYILYGIKRKSFLSMRTGLGLIAATIFTLRYYHKILPIEIAMLIAGIMIIAASYALIQYLKTSEYGYTSNDLYPGNKNILNAEALIIAQTFASGSSKTESNDLLGGGSGGGGGATGNF